MLDYFLARLQPLWAVQLSPPSSYQRNGQTLPFDFDVDVCADLEACQGKPIPLQWLEWPWFAAKGPNASLTAHCRTPFGFHSALLR